jgi:hypothetical protein
MLSDLGQEGHLVPGIGCPGRASTLLNYAGIDPDAMPYIAEQSTSLKLGLALPGNGTTLATHTARRDLYEATGLHRLLQVLLELPAPLYHHHRLITDAAGRKLAKSARDTSLKSLRESGRTPADIRRMVGLG